MCKNQGEGPRTSCMSGHRARGLRDKTRVAPWRTFDRVRPGIMMRARQNAWRHETTIQALSQPHGVWVDHRIDERESTRPSLGKSGEIHLRVGHSKAEISRDPGAREFNRGTQNVGEKKWKTRSPPSRLCPDGVTSSCHPCASRLSAVSATESSHVETAPVTSSVAPERWRRGPLVIISIDTDSGSAAVKRMNWGGVERERGCARQRESQPLAHDPLSAVSGMAHARERRGPLAT